MDAPKTIAVQKTKYGDFMHQHGNDEIFDLTPTREQLSSYKAQSSFNPNKYTREQAEDILFKRANQSSIEVGGDVNHYLKDRKRKEYVRTLSNSLQNPDIIYSSGNNGYVVKKYNTSGKPFFDFIVKKDGKLWTKFPTDENYISNQFKKSIQDVSLNGRIVGSNGGLTHSLPPTTDSNIPRRGVVVNKNLLQHKP